MLVQIFWPFTVYVSPVRSARVWSDVRSDPACGSLNPWLQTVASLAMADRCRVRCSSLP